MFSLPKPGSPAAVADEAAPSTAAASAKPAGSTTPSPLRRGRRWGRGYSPTKSTARQQPSSCGLRGAFATSLLVLAVASVVVHQCAWLRRVLREHRQQQRQSEEDRRSRRQRRPSVEPRNQQQKQADVSSERGRLAADAAAHISTIRGGDNDETSSSSSSGRSVQWLKSPDFRVDPDAFSDSWWMPIANFAPLNLTKVVAVEHACKRPLRLQADKVRMALDWLDLSVEHMSKWWKTLRAPDYAYANDRAIEYLERYRDKALTDDIELYGPYRPLMHSTMAIVSFMPYKSKHRNHAENGRKLTVASLSATLASLVRVGMGRVVVVGYHRNADDADEHLRLVRETFDVLAEKAGLQRQLTADEERGAEETQSIRTVLGCELAYVTVTTDHVLTPAIAKFLKKGEVNLPRGALVGMQEALAGHDHSWTRAWLGRTTLHDSPWRHLYLTEPDTLLLTRPTTVPHLRRLLDEGLVLAPHRLQPFPYQADAPESMYNDSFITTEQWSALHRPIETLDALGGDACCDEQAGWYRPGSDPHLYDRCEDQWWKCGFSTRMGNHSRVLDHYQLMRLSHGTGVTTLAGTGHGRRCIPTRSSGAAAGCVRQMSVNHPDHPDNPWIGPYRAKVAAEKQQQQQQ